MKSLLTLLSIAVALTILPLVAEAEVVNGVNWADDVTAYASYIQNYDGALMDVETEFWVIGAPDADVNGNGYAWDWGTGDLDYVAGWRGGAADEYIIVYFDTGLVDVLGDDLTICLYSGPKADCTVLASTNGANYTWIGSIGGGTPGYLSNETFDFDGQFTGDVHYVKVLRAEKGKDTGMFFDAFGGTAVPEPGTMTLLFAALGFVAAWRRNRSRKPR